jgi:hypothetical protein
MLVLDGVYRDDMGDEVAFREVHVERAYTEVDVRRLLAGAGLEPEELFDCFTFQPPNERSLRHFWVARKPYVAGL